MPSKHAKKQRLKIVNSNCAGIDIGSRDRSFGAVSSLEIIYGNGKTASIAVAYLSKHDFDAVCDQLKGMLNLGKIKTKYT